MRISYIAKYVYGKHAVFTKDFLRCLIVVIEKLKYYNNHFSITVLLQSGLFPARAAEKYDLILVIYEFYDTYTHVIP